MSEHYDPRDVPVQTEYPDFVPSDKGCRHRWDLAMAVAANLLGDDCASWQVRSVAEWLFHCDSIATD